MSTRSEEHTSELQSLTNLVCRLLLEKKKLPNFVKVGPLPPHQEKALHLLDSVDYSANAGVLPVVACMGENDVFFQAHVLMEKAMAKEGLTLVNLISPGTGHVIDPKTHAEQMRFFF